MKKAESTKKEAAPKAAKTDKTVKAVKAEKPKKAASVSNNEAVVYSQAGKESGRIPLPASVFGLPWNADLVHQVVTSMLSSQRSNIAHTKTRGEIRGGGKKPWKQKGTGRARHGSSRSPIWVGGGVTHGPRNDKNYDRKVNRKMKAKALYTILSQKVRDGEVLFVESIALKEAKTKEAKSTLGFLGSIKGYEAISTRRNNAAYIALGKADVNIHRAFNNFSNIQVDEVRNINPVDILKYKYLVISAPTESVKFLEGKLTGSNL